MSHLETGPLQQSVPNISISQLESSSTTLLVPKQLEHLPFVALVADKALAASDSMITSTNLVSGLEDGFWTDGDSSDDDNQPRPAAAPLPPISAAALAQSARNARIALQNRPRGRPRARPNHCDGIG
ncbi:UNVERIFIED_CONTAM: hypothetical protein HDU68_008134 [Siphonaria sp. JEL0065]|nr:hypothetical protein HDU68_008134 [Siphonaria sp. JEL0065]